MTELLQLLTAAKSLDDQAGLQETLNQHAAIINQQAQQIDLLNRQILALQGGQDFTFWFGLASVLTLGAALIVCVTLLERKLSRLQP